MNLLRTTWQMWKKIGQVIGDFIARIILTIFYFTIFLPFGLGVRLLSDPLAIKQGSSINWLERESDSGGMEGSRRLS